MDERRQGIEPELSSTSQGQGSGVRAQGSAAEHRTPNTEDRTPSRTAGSDADTSRLLAHVRHEFGQPLTVIQGFSELIQEGNLSPEEVKEYAAEIFKEATHLAEMVARLRVDGGGEGVKG